MSDAIAAIQSKLTGGGVEAAARDAERIATAAADNPALDVDELITQRIAGTPLEYLIGRTTFMGVELLVDPGALVPREETEILGRTALGVLQALDVAEPRVIDMCCGAGNLACALAVKVPSVRVWGSDLTDGCVHLARRNVERLGLGDRVTIAQGDLFTSLVDQEIEGTIDVIVCNPPYISTSRLTEGDRRKLLEHEPREAFDGGPYGLSIHQRVIKDARAFLRPGGHVLFEFGLGQDRQLAALFKRSRAYGEVQFESDADGNPRVAHARSQESQ
jgi:release factor glutamine methyltransferase